jgi:site-specific recombinase XerD
MRKAKGNPLPTLVENFFTHYLITERHLSPCTVASYRDTCRLLLTYLEAQNHRSASAQRLEDWDAPNILSFLAYLEKERGCCARSRNLRLAAIHSFMKYVAQRSPEFLALTSRVLAIPSKRHAQPLLGYLMAPEVQAILDATDPTTSSGRRDRFFFQLLYNTGARVSELVALNRQDLLAGTCQTITLHGKGRKRRTVPLWSKTARQMRQWLDQLSPEASTPVFTNRWGSRISRFGIEKQLTVAVAKAALTCLSLRGRRISPHVFRHTTAMHLLQANVDITSIALWLGHESPITTHKYVEADLEMKKKTLSRLKEPTGKLATFAPKDALLAFLERL